MEMLLQRYSWAVNLVAVLLGAYLAARTVNTLAGAAIAPKPSLLQQAGAVPPPSSAGPPRTELDAHKVARLFARPPPKPAPPGADIGPVRVVPARSEPHP